MIFLLIFIFLFLCYSTLIFYYRQGWKAIPYFNINQPGPSIFVSVIIPARNEEKNIGALLRSLRDQSYPRQFFEIIVVDDHSSDSTAEIVSSFPDVTLLKLEDDFINSYKKKAIEKGIAAASGELIVTTDADCVPLSDWLKILVAFKQSTNSVFIVAPVALNCNSQIVQIFQAMDFMILQGITGASAFRKVHSMCNGANLAYERQVFFEVGGFSGIDQIASGDDMLLMHKIAKKYPARIQYLKSKEAIVSTSPMPSWKAFFNQRVRWASKATHYEDRRIFWVLLLVYLFNFSFLVLLVVGFWNHFYWLYLLLAIILKTGTELSFFYTIASFFDKQWTVKYFFFFQPLHIFYTLIAGLLGQVGQYEWKGRRVK